MRYFHHIFVRAGVLLLVVGVTQTAWGLNIQHFRPSTGSTKGYQVMTSDTLQQGQFGFGLVTNYGHNMFTSRVSGTPDQHIVDHLITADFLAEYAPLDWMMINLDMPLAIYESTQATTPPLVADSNTGGKPGDLSLRLKFQIFDAEETTSGLGLAVAPQVNFPTGNKSKFIGDDNVTGSVMAVGDWQIHSNRFYVNAGYRIRERESISNGDLVVDDEMLYGVGFQRPLARELDLDVIVEVFGSTAFAKNPRTVHRLPLEAMGLVQKRWLADKSLVTTLGGSAGLTDGYGNPDFRVILGVAYVRPLEEEREVMRAPVKVREKIEITEKIHFEFNKAVVRPESYPVVDQVVDIMKERKDILKVQVEGHTDAVGGDAYNQRLSERRSQAVVEYMVSKGIERERLAAIGFGETKPIASNDTAEGRATNRRTEFIIVERTER